MSNHHRGYGTVLGPSPEDGVGAGEQMPLLRKSPSDSLLHRFRRFMTVDVRRERADIILVLCYLVTGLLDSASISIWGSFVSMQTGMLLFGCHGHSRASATAAHSSAARYGY
jgi:hypothetical protein